MYLRFGIAILFLLSPAVVQGDDPFPPRLLDLNVVALDDHRQPVNDMTAAEFEITDAGKPQKIVFFRHRDARKWETGQLGPNEFSNRNRGGVPHATVILYDLLNESFGTRGYAANQLIRALENLKTADYLYLYILDLEGRLFTVRGLPIEGEDPFEAPGPPWTRNIKALLDRARKDTLRQRPEEIDVAVRVQVTFDALANLGFHLLQVPGRKNIVWITDGVPVSLGPVRSDTGDFVDFTPQMRVLSQALERSGVAIYPVRELMIGSPDRIGALSAGAGATGGAGTGMSSLETLDEFADVTGGRRTTGKDISTAIEQATNDARTSYQIGYYAPPNNWDSKYHKLRVITKRKGVHIQAKTGYYAWAEPADAEFQRSLERIVAAQFDAAEIGIRGKLEVDPRDATRASLTAFIDARDVALVQNGDYSDGQLRMSIVGYAGTSPASTGVIPVNVHWTAQEREKALKVGIAIKENIPISKFAKIRVIVFDRGSNAIGSLTIPISR